ncbi:MAG: hypothetical protein ACOX5R_19575 [bacterium]|jgi:hypothetical protein
MVFTQPGRISPTDTYEIETKPLERPASGIPWIAAVFYAFFLFYFLNSVPSALFAYHTTDALSALFTIPEFTQWIYTGIEATHYPWQNLNFLVWALIKAAQPIPLPKIWLLVIGQTLLVFLFLRSMNRFICSWLLPELHYPFFLLLLVHPVTWYNLFLSPSNLLTAWLLLEVFYRLISPIAFSRSYFLSLLLLSFSGVTGFYASVLICITRILILIYNSISRARYQGIGDFSLPLSLLALLPSFLFYLILSLQARVPGGPVLLGYPTLFSELSLANLLNGIWTEHSRLWLLFLCNGFIHLPITVPVFGLLLVVGLVSVWQQGSHVHSIFFTITVLLTGLLIMIAFLPADSIDTCSLLPVLLSLCLFIQGLTVLIPAHFPQGHMVRLGLCAGFAILFLIFIPAQWNRIEPEADYMQRIADSIHDHLCMSTPSHTPDFAVRFHPALFANLYSEHTPYPLELALHTWLGEQNLSRSGIQMDVNSFWETGTLIFYPDYQDARTQRNEYQPESQWFSLLHNYYDRTTIKNITVYTPLQESKKELRERFLSQSIQQGYALHWLLKRGWKNLAPVSMDYQQRLYNLMGEWHSRNVGMQWDFEEGYHSVRQTGIAFGFSPTVVRGMVGMRCAGPPTPEAVQSLGTLESEPFIIEADDLHLLANLPKDSTQSYICLAVWQQVPFGDYATVRQARHINEYTPGHMLMGDTFYYIRPHNLVYEGDTIRGWRVVRQIRGGSTSGWQSIRWSMEAWKNRQAIWLAADRDTRSGVWIDHILQRNRPPDYTWNFEYGDYLGWKITGTAFGDRPAAGRFRNQQPIIGYEGNFLINTYLNGSDEPQGTMSTPPIPITLNQMTFLIGGGDDINSLYLALVVDGKEVLKATGDNSERLRRVTWDLTPWMGQNAQILIADLSSGYWGHILVDDIQMMDSLRLE